MALRRPLAFSVVAMFGAAAGALAPAAAGQQLVADTAYGKVAGQQSGDTMTFLGIPYAASPTGPLRWRAPMPPTPWNDIRSAIRFGAACPQNDDHAGEAWAKVGRQSEDCLYLNVWRPRKAGKYPVMVFIHGGGFNYGSAGVPLYDGAALSRRGAVIVTINYRLGLLGFFAHPALTREAGTDPTGNFGVMDQIAALRWVRANIAVFGGDPANVTLFGESAGAGSVQVLMGSPAAVGLFDKAISESGAGGAVLMTMTGGEGSAEAKGKALAAGIGLPDATMTQLRAIPVGVITKGRGVPFIDGRIVTASPGEPFSRGREAAIPLMIGANSNESTLAANSAMAARRVLKPSYDRMLQSYRMSSPAGGAKPAETRLAEDTLSVLPSLSIGAMHAAAGRTAYAYFYTQIPASKRANWLGSPHGGELEYVFETKADDETWDAADLAVSKKMGDAWVRFANTGDPNGRGLPHWSPLPRDHVSYLEIGQTIADRSLTPLRDEVRRIALASAQAGWTRQDAPDR